jgi:hypothetical protein
MKKTIIYIIGFVLLGIHIVFTPDWIQLLSGAFFTGAGVRMILDDLTDSLR